MSNETPKSLEALAIREAADDLRKNVYNPAQTEYQRTYNAAMNDAADFLINRAIELESAA
jgi:hypothetical protein